MVVYPLSLGLHSALDEVKNVDLSNHPVLLVMAIAVAASLLAEIRFASVRVPVLVWEMVFGIVLGPQVLGLVRTGSLLEWFGGVVGLGALFFMAGLDLDLQKIKGRSLSLAVSGWAVSFALGLCVAVIFHLLPTVRAPMMIVALALATTSLGALMPMLRDSGKLDSKFGSFVVAAGAAAEFGPVVVVSLVLTRAHGGRQEAALMLGFVAIAFTAALVALGARPPRILALLERSMHSSTQLPVCISLLLVASLDVLSERFGLEAVLGAFAAGMVVGLASQGEANKLFHEKMEAVCFGFLIPFFFVMSGVNLDLRSLFQSPKSMVLLPVFLTLFLVVRGAPVFLYRSDLAKAERWPFALYSATALPMVVAITSIGVRTGRMHSDIAAALVGAGLLSVLAFPTIAGALLSKSARTADPQSASSC
jgi:Kef-type K+ transport system membrane component KefB